MKRIALAIIFTALALSGALADESCKAQASDKKLAGAALTSFMRNASRTPHPCAIRKLPTKNFLAQPKIASPRSA